MFSVPGRTARSGVAKGSDPTAFRSLRAGLLAGGLGAALLTASCAVVDETHSALQPGDCTGPPAEGVDYFEVEELSCEEPHALEVFALVALPADGSPFPGHEAAWRRYELRCRRAFNDYVGVNQSESRFGIQTVYPGRESWEAGVMDGLCLLGVFTANGSHLPTRGSKRGSGE